MAGSWMKIQAMNSLVGEKQDTISLVGGTQDVISLVGERQDVISLVGERQNVGHQMVAEKQEDA